MDDLRTSTVHDDRTTLAIAAGLVAALLGAAGWAATVILLDYEIGWVAWAIGGLVGLAMTKATANRSRQLAVVAAGLALVGLLAGKVLVAAGSAGPIAEELAGTPEYLASAVAWDMYGAEELAPATMEAVRNTEASGDTLSDAVWAEMLEQGTARVASMSEAERRAVADGVAAAYVRDLGIVGGVRAQLSAFDLLWLLLALGTAFRMMDAAEPVPAPVATAQDDEAVPVA